MDVLSILATAVLTKEWVVDQRVLKPLRNQRHDSQELLPLIEEAGEQGGRGAGGKELNRSPPCGFKPLDLSMEKKEEFAKRCIARNTRRPCFKPPDLSVGSFSPAPLLPCSPASSLAHQQTVQVTPVHQLDVQSTSEQFTIEQNQLQNRVEALETHVSDIQVQQFSPTAVLEGEAILGFSGVSGRDIDDSVVFQESIELILNVSFTGEDALEVGIESGNGMEFSFVGELTNEGRLGFPSNTDGDRFELSELSYEFPIGDRASLFISTTGNDLSDFNPFFSDSDDTDDDNSDGAISQFGSENPIHDLVEDAGVQLNYDLTDTLGISLGYFSGEESNPESGAGLFNGDQSAFVQLEFEPSDRLLFGFTYIHTYNDSDLETDTGSLRSQINLERPVIGNSYGISASFAPSSRLAIGGWVGLTKATVIDLGNADVWNYAFTLALPDFGKEGNLLGVIIGQEPRLTSTSGFTIDDRRSDPDTSLHIELFYRNQLSDQISVTPGLIWITAPNHDNSNPDILVFTVRTTFKF